MKKMGLSLLLLLLLPLGAQESGPESSNPNKVSDEERRKEILLPRIDRKYRAGGYLIYDCEDQHFVCADARGFDQCELDRQTSREEGRLILSCSPLKRFQTYELCLEEFYRLMHKASPKTICVNPKAR